MTADLAKVQQTHPVGGLLDEVDGRVIRIGTRWLDDFASGNYVGFDVDSEIIESVPDYLQRWGTQPRWSRLHGSADVYEEIEERLTGLLGCEDTLVLPDVTRIHSTVIPVLARSGTIFLDHRAHWTVADGCEIARSQGASVVRCDPGHPGRLVEMFERRPDGPRLICVDGLNTTTGEMPDLGSLAMLARAHDALLYIDDGNGFGVFGERGPDELCSYGKRGNSIVRHLDESYDNIVLVGGFSTACSSLLAFLALPTRLKRLLKHAVPLDPMAGPAPLTSLATVLEGMSVNERRGDQLRLELHRMAHHVLDALAQMGLHTPNRTGYPLIEIPLAQATEAHAVRRFLFEHGIHVAEATQHDSRQNAGVRIRLTSANTSQQVEHLIDVLRVLAAWVGCSSRASVPSAPDGDRERNQLTAVC